ncbi:MAG: hemolysin family protein [Myxococcota bacterium]|jgi:CBS domain containing-hemolysin-like protein|nr:hemolysin family protein [Myxococcota bacterium]
MILTLIILGLILLNAIFVAAEFAMVASSVQVLELRQSAGSKAAKVVLDIARHPLRRDRYVATAQVGITLASLGLGMYGEHQVATLLASPLEALGLAQWGLVDLAASVIAIGLLTYLHIVLGEMVPKSLALQSPESSASFLSWPMRWSGRLMWPLVAGLDRLGRLLLRMMRLRAEPSLEAAAPDELRLMVHESIERGELSPQAGEVLEELLDFGALRAEDVMTPRVRVKALPLGSHGEQLARLLRRYRGSRYPVYEGSLDNIVGTVLVRELIPLLLEPEATLRRELLHPVTLVPQDLRLDDVLARMRSEKTPLVVVLDEFGGTAGVIGHDNLVAHVVAEEVTEPTLVSWNEAAQCWVAQGTIHLDELAERTGIDIQSEHVDTLSGLVMSRLGRPPVLGDSVEIGEVKILVKWVLGRGLGEAELRRQNTESV